MAAIVSVRREELPLALSMFGYFFLVITTFWILKPLKKTFFITEYDQTGFSLLGWQMEASQAELVAKVANLFVALVAASVFTVMSRRRQREALTRAFSVFFIAGFAVYAFLLQAGGDAVVWSFYLFGDLYSTLMVATFFAFLNDSVTSDTAKRLYGLVGLGGVVGGVFGTTFVRIFIRSLTPQQWMFVAAGIAVIIVFVAQYAGAWVRQNQPAVPPPADPPPHSVEEPAEAASFMSSARTVMRSPYLLSIVALVGIYEIVSTILDFQFTATIEHYLDGPAIGEQFSTVYAITNWTSMAVQLFVTSAVMTRFGVRTALMFLPLAVVLGSAAFATIPILWVGSLLNTADNGFSYSINQSAKEALYVPLKRSEKYQAKAFIDMFAQRFAKSLAVFISLGVTVVFTDFSSLRILSVVALALGIVWIGVVRYVGRKFDELAEGAGR